MIRYTSVLPEVEAIQHLEGGELAKKKKAVKKKGQDVPLVMMTKDGGVIRRIGNVPVIYQKC